MAQLTERYKRFCEEYVANGYNASLAYQTTHPNVTAKTASNSGYRLLKRQDIRDYITEIQKERVEALNITAERLLEELSKMAFAEKGDDDYTASIKLKALELIQKQLGLQSQKIEANVNQETTIVVDIQEEE